MATKSQFLVDTDRELQIDRVDIAVTGPSGSSFEHMHKKGLSIEGADPLGRTEVYQSRRSGPRGGIAAIVGAVVLGP